MKIITILCIFVAGAESTSYSINSGYGSQEMSRLNEPSDSRSTAFKYESPSVNDYSPVRTDSYGQILERPAEFRFLRQEIPITRFNHIINPAAGEYSYGFAGANGIVSRESGFLKGVSVGRVVSDGYGYGNTRVEEVVGAAQTKSGETSWCSPEGLRFTLTYTADETGYHPTLTKGLCQQPATLVRDSYATQAYYKDTRLTTGY